MCGISGFIDKHKTLHDLKLMQQQLNHRGPDAGGVFFENNIGLAHNRLSIIDLSTNANQPFYFEDLVLIFNGEVYNYVEIKEALVKLGYHFATNSDTEVLIKGFHAWGVKIVDRIIGMFAFAVVNKTTRELYLFRDRMGVKPLFYKAEGDRITFASELKAFLRNGSGGQVDVSGLGEYLKYGYTVSNHNTFFSDIKKVPPGHYIRFAQGALEIRKYWDACDYVLDPLTNLSEQQLTDRLEELMIDAFKYRMVSDVPVGIFFSGGVDSTALVAILSKQFQLNTFTIGFDDPRYDETGYAREIAKYFKTNHTERILRLDEAKQRLYEFYKIYDEPFYDSSGIPTSLVTQIARENNMKVVLSSEGGDELFAGYPSYMRFFNIGSKTLFYPKALRKIAGNIGEMLDGDFTGRRWGNKWAKLSQVIKSNDWMEFYLRCISTVTEATAKKNIEGYRPSLETDIPRHVIDSIAHPVDLFMLWDIKHLIPNDYLVKTDRATMHHGVEGREPFLDHRLIEFALRVPLQYKVKDGNAKYLLKKVLQRYIPEKYFNRPKMGFSVPLFSWFKKDMDRLFDAKLAHATFSQAWPQINHQWIEKQLRIYRHSKSVDREMNLVMMWKFLGLMLWHEEYMHG